MNLSVFVLEIFRFFLFLYINRDSITLPSLPDRILDTTALSEITVGMYPEGKSVSYALRMRLEWQQYRILFLNSSEERGAAEGDRFARGVYRLRSFELVLKENFGFFRIVFPGAAGHAMTVYPSGKEEGELRISRRFNRETPDPKKSLLKENSFYESRLYYPGDDPRRINWKLKARYGDLFVKDGYHAMASGKAVLLLVNGSGNPGDVDDLMRECLLLWDHLAEQEFHVSLLASGRRHVARIPQDFSREQREDSLAAIPPLPLVIEDSVFASFQGAVYLFSTEDALPSVPEETGNSSKEKILIIVPSNADSQGDISSIPYSKRGWQIHAV